MVNVISNQKRNKLMESLDIIIYGAEHVLETCGDETVDKTRDALDNVKYFHKMLLMGDQINIIGNGNLSKIK